MNTLRIPHTDPYPNLPGSHDALIFTMSYFDNVYHRKPLEFVTSVSDLKRILIETAMLRHSVKEHAPTISPAQYQENAETRRDAFGVSRHFMILDFDQGPDLSFIQTQLAQFMYFMWTTHSHQLPGKGSRYRVFLPLEKPISYADWRREYQYKFARYFEAVGFVGRNAVDRSAFKFGQLAILPCTNPAIGFVELWFNDGDTTQLFELNLLPTVATSVSAPTSNNTTTHWQPASGDMAYLISVLQENPALQRISSCPIHGDGGLNRKTIAAALQSIGANYSDFAQLDRVMKKIGSNTDSAKAWQHASQAHVTKHSGVLIKLLTPFQRKLFGIQ